MRRQKFIRQWEQTRAKEHTIFTLRTAILWGGLMTLNLAYGDYFGKGQAADARLYLFSILFLFGGLLMAAVTWNVDEKKYLKKTQNGRK